MNNSTETPYAYDRQRERLQGMLLMANADSIREMQKASAIDSQFLTCRDCIESLPPDKVLMHSHVLTQTNGAEFQISSYLCPAFRT